MIIFRYCINAPKLLSEVSPWASKSITVEYLKLSKALSYRVYIYFVTTPSIVHLLIRINPLCLLYVCTQPELMGWFISSLYIFYIFPPKAAIYSCMGKVWYFLNLSQGSKVKQLPSFNIRSLNMKFDPQKPKLNFVSLIWILNVNYLSDKIFYWFL